VGFFQRRAESRAANVMVNMAQEMAAQLAASDKAAGVLFAVDNAGITVESLRQMFRVTLNAGAPRLAVDNGMNRAELLDAELYRAFPGVSPRALHVALNAAIHPGFDPSLRDCANELGVDADALRRKFLTLGHLSQEERDDISAGLDASSSLKAELDASSPLKAELRAMVRQIPSITLHSGLSEDGALELLASMLGELLKQHVGAYARLGRDNQVPWVFLVDRFEALRPLTPADRTLLAGPCGYIRQAGMLTTGIEELLAAKP